MCYDNYECSKYSHIFMFLDVFEIRHGLTRRMSKDVTEIFKKLIKSVGHLNLKEFEVKPILGDPYPGKQKKLILLLKNNRHTAFMQNNGRFILPDGQFTLSLCAERGILNLDHRANPDMSNTPLRPLVKEYSKADLIEKNTKPSEFPKLPESTNSLEQSETVSDETVNISLKYTTQECPKEIPKKRLRQHVFIICNISQGGTAKYLKDITDHYKTPLFFYIKKKRDLKKHRFQSDDILLVQQLLFTGISVKDLIYIKHTANPNIVVSIHDFFWFYHGRPSNAVIKAKDWPHNAYLNKALIVDPKVSKFLGLANHVILPSKFCLDQYSKHFNTHNFRQVYHNDIKVDPLTHYVPEIRNNTINIGMMQALTLYKGLKYVNFLRAKYKAYKGYEIRILSIGEGLPAYEVRDFFKVIKKYNLHALMHLNALAETYSYTISYSMNTGLPIIYNNLGAFKERIPIKDHYFMVYDTEGIFDFQKLISQFEKMLDYIITNAGKINKPRLCEVLDIVYNDFYNKLFISWISLMLRCYNTEMR